jgi:hypothetical protein
MAALKARLKAILDAIDIMTQTGALQQLADSIGHRLVAAINSFTSFVRDELIPDLRQLAGIVVFIKDIFGGWGRLLKFTLVAYIVSPVIPAIVSLAGAIASLAITMGLTPFGWFMLGLAAIAGAAYVIYRNWTPVAKFFKGLWGDVQTSFEGFTEFLHGFMSGDWARIVHSFDKIKSAADALIKVYDLAAGLAGFLPQSGTIGKAFNFSKGLAFGPQSIDVGPLPKLPPQPVVPLAASHGGAMPGSLDDVLSQIKALLGDARIKVDFENMPRGVRVTKDAASKAPIDLSMGWALQDAQ